MTPLRYYLAGCLLGLILLGALLLLQRAGEWGRLSHRPQVSLCEVPRTGARPALRPDFSVVRHA